VRHIYIIIGIVAAALLAGCAETKYVPEGMYLVNRVQVKTDGSLESKHINTSQMRSYVRQKGNSRWFSVMKLPLATYSLSGRDSAKWINRALRSMGEKPVLFDSVQASYSVNDLQQELQNQGYLSAGVELWTRAKGKKMDVIYVLHPGEVYRLGSVSYEVPDTGINRLLRLDLPENQGLKPGQHFSVSLLDGERKRITQQLTNQGYYRFHKEYIHYEADSMAGSRDIGLRLKLEPFRTADNSETSHPRYRIGTIRYSSGDLTDSVIHLNRRVLEESTRLRPGYYYSAGDLQKTYNQFGRLGAVKYTNISFREHPDTTVLDCQIQLLTNKPSTLSFQPEGTNTAGDLGAAASLTYQNRNLFFGAENLTIELRGAYEAIRGLEGYRNQNFVEYSLETRLQFPRFIMPFLNSEARRRINATSEVSLLYDMQDRPEFHRRLLSAAWRYKWQPQTRRSHYQLDLLDLNYVFMPWISNTFYNQYLLNVSSRNAILRYNYEDLFIMKTGFGYSYNNGVYALKTNIETAGNLLMGGSKLFGAEKDENGQYRLFNIAFAQYVKADIDLTRSLRFDYNNSLVLHVGFGIAYPYGNSSVLPFEKRYFSGGANSVRGWSVRSLGPGKFKGNDGSIDFINQTGDMKLDLNAEFRSHLFWKIGGALFIDAGNIWTLRYYKVQEGGQFSFSDFPSQLAASYGVGLRFNFDYFIVRFDLGMKAINPSYDEDDDEHFPLLHPRFSRDYAFHFAVGLPF